MAHDTKNFKVSEFTCKCGCGRNVTDQKVIDMCQLIRERAGIAVNISSGSRCEKHNSEVGGVAGSYHVQGKAADLACSIGAKRLFVLIADMKAKRLLPDLQYCKLYLSKNFVHVDIGHARNCIFDIG